MNLKKYITIALIVIAIVLGFIISRKAFNKPTIETPPTVEQLLKLPETWKNVADSDVALKLEKTVTSGLKPQIVLIKSSSKDALTPAKYTDRLIAGAKSAIPSFRVADDKRYSAENNYSAIITGYYYNKNIKISLIQRVYIKGEEVNTLTASFVGDINSEIESVLDNIVTEKIGK